MIPLVNADPALAVDVVFSDDTDVVLKLLPAPTPEALEAMTPEERVKAMEPKREERYPLRVLRREEVESIGPNALVLWVRAIDGDEQFACTGGYRSLIGPGLAKAAHLAAPRAVVRVTGPGVDVRTPEEVARFVPRLRLLYREELGEWVLDECTGVRDPFASRR